MMWTNAGILLNLILGLTLTVGESPVTSNGRIVSTTAEASISEGLSKGIIAVIIGICLTSFFVIIIAYYMVRGYQKQGSNDLATIEENGGNTSDHVAAKSNMGLRQL